MVVTYDEFGGQWDHVAPPGQGSTTRGAHDAWGPGTRIPALLVSASMRCSGVDHTVYDTTSIMATIEHSFGLKPCRPGTRRSATWAAPSRWAGARSDLPAVAPARRGQDGRGAYMMTATPTSARRAPATSYRSGR